MKKFIFMFALLLSNFVLAGEFPTWGSDIKYFKMGSCEEHNLAFNAARFSKIPLGFKRDNLDIYLQMILFFSDEGIVTVRTTEMGLAGCQQTDQGEVCSYRPYPDTKIRYQSTWNELTPGLISIAGLGSIQKIRDDYPWLGFKFTFNANYSYPVLRDVVSVGGKVQINFDESDRNVVLICR
jgi:hypothetical protein